MISKKELFDKLSKLRINDLKKLNLDPTEIEYIKTKLLNDNIGLKLNFQEIDEEFKMNYIVLEEEKQLGINVKENKNNNLLIEGDNYYALKALKTNGVKVDVIYIDPPYNTGKEFIYNDNYSTKKVVGKDDPHKHSKWLSFMKRRLKLAKDLLSDEGVIFVSIDDNEQAYLKVLMDEIFGEDNFMANMPRAIASGGKNNGTTIAKEHEYVLVYGYAKSFNGIQSSIVQFTLDDNDGRGKYQLRDLVAAPGAFERNGSQTMPFEFEGKAYKPTKSNGKPWYWRWGSKRMTLGQELNIIVAKNEKLYSKLYINLDFKQGDNKLINKIRTQLISSRTFDDKKYINGKGSKDIKSLDLDFSFPKPINLIKDLMKLHTNNSIIVLDFFAGSGTTGQAVMELNEEDGGNRRFILVTNNESIEREKLEKKTNMPQPQLGIARSITRERLYRVIKGKGSNKEKFKWEYSKTKRSLTNNSVAYLKVKEIHKQDGEFEDIDKSSIISKREFNKDISVIDLQTQENDG